MTIHVLHGGQAFCGQPGIPRDWPDDHRWVPLKDWAKATCFGCRANVERTSNVGGAR